MFKTQKTWLAVVSASLMVGSAWAADTIDQDLEQIVQNPEAFRLQHIQKTDEQGNPVPVQSKFAQDDIRTREFVIQRDLMRKKFCQEEGGARICLGDVMEGRAGILGNDRAEDLVDNGASLIRSLEKMSGLQKAQLPHSPWSDDYWALYKGSVGARYADPEFPAVESWKENKNYVDAKTLRMIFESSSSMDTLSPSEKYDLLVGDTAGTLTAFNWSTGEQYFRRSGKVETWMGICHGWAPAAYMLPRPTSMIDVVAADGRTKIRFYPADIKALGSLLWAQAHPSTRFIGGRCNTKSPDADASGHQKDQDCFDTNPGTWHLAVVNQIGVAGRSMVMDATYDYEVWNQPIYGYSYTYFNPQTMKRAETIDQARVELRQFPRDRFRHRADDAVAVVGVSMEVTYIVETQPTQSPNDHESRDGRRKARYTYDVELNARGEIVGGEWYQAEHPDFLWTPGPTVKAVSVADSRAPGNWDAMSPLPAAWSAPARRAASAGQPLGKIVDALFLRAAMQAR